MRSRLAATTGEPNNGCAWERSTAAPRAKLADAGATSMRSATLPWNTSQKCPSHRASRKSGGSTSRPPLSRMVWSLLADLPPCYLAMAR
eukprot:8295642-Pyramimonas_sp.AAC.1